MIKQRLLLFILAVTSHYSRPLQKFKPIVFLGAFSAHRVSGSEEEMEMMKTGLSF